ncbi:hypothetical protein BJ912DRAFT_360283 [Pholiota molesta]|nr:hypothetical protein BJ912DRAFT_360283 [Pholiota molesta]
MAYYDGCLICAWWMATMGRSFTIYNRTRKSGYRTMHNDPEVFRSDYVSLAIVEWEKALKYIGTEWKTSSAGCALIIPLSVTLLQVNDVSQNILARTAVMAAFLFAIAGLALGARLITRLPQFHKKNGRNAWDKASRSCSDLESAEFWSLLAFPMALLIWSVGLCVMSVLILVWTSQDGSVLSIGRAKAKTIVSASFLMVLAMTLAAFMYRGMQITRRLV